MFIKLFRKKRMYDLEADLNKMLISINSADEQEQTKLLHDFKVSVREEAKKRKLDSFLAALLLFVVNVLLLLISFSLFYFIFTTLFNLIMVDDESAITFVTSVSFILTFIFISYFFKFWYSLLLEKYRMKVFEVEAILKKLTLIRDAINTEVPDSIKKHHYLNYLEEAKEYFKNK